MTDDIYVRRDVLGRLGVIGVGESVHVVKEMVRDSCEINRETAISLLGHDPCTALRYLAHKMDDGSIALFFGRTRADSTRSQFLVVGVWILRTARRFDLRGGSNADIYNTLCYGSAISNRLSDRLTGRRIGHTLSILSRDEEHVLVLDKRSQHRILSLTPTLTRAAKMAA